MANPPVRTSILKLMKADGNQYAIPVYQRNYVWETKDQIKVFLEDIKAIIRDEKKRHFIGMIVDYEVAGSSVSHQYYVIDGQQRLTTIFLIYYALLQRAKKEGNQQMIGVFKRSLFDEDADPGFEQKLKPMAEDLTVFNAIMSGETSGLSDEQKRNNVYSAYEFILEYVMNDWAEYTLEEIREALSRVDLIEFPLAIGDDAQQIFESINVKGKTLNSIDLIRNFVLMSIPENKKADFYIANWMAIENAFGDEDSILAFFRQFLIAQLKEVVNERVVYQSFKDWYSKMAETMEPKAIFDLIKKYVAAYRFLLIDKTTSLKRPLREALRDLRNIRSEMPRPILLQIAYLFREKSVSEEDLVEIITILNSYIERRMMMGKNTSGISRSMAMLPKYVEDDVAINGGDYVEAIRFNVINRNFNNGAWMPTDRELREELSKANAYVRKTAVHIFFDRLESKDRDEAAIDTMSLPIEHLMPQDGSEWIGEMGIDLEEYNYQRNRLGNLTLVTGSVNSKMSNHPFEYKRDLLADAGHFRLTKPIIDEPSWGVPEIDKRTERLIESFLELYPYKPSERAVEQKGTKGNPTSYEIMPLDMAKVSSWTAQYATNAIGVDITKSFLEYLASETDEFNAKYTPNGICLVKNGFDQRCCEIQVAGPSMLLRVLVPGKDESYEAPLPYYINPESNGWGRMRMDFKITSSDQFPLAKEILLASADRIKAKQPYPVNIERFASKAKEFLASCPINGIRLDRSEKPQYTRFTSNETRAVSQGGYGKWIDAPNLLAYEILQKPNYLMVWLLIGPGNAEEKERIFKEMKRFPVFKKFGRGEHPQNWQGMASVTLWTRKDDTGSEEENEAIAFERLKSFFEHEFIDIEAALAQMK